MASYPSTYVMDWAGSVMGACEGVGQIQGASGLEYNKALTSLCLTMVIEMLTYVVIDICLAYQDSQA
jgi:hypothetical protein